MEEPSTVAAETDGSLGQRRWRAAQASLGTSNAQIYAMFERCLDARRAQGDVLDFGAGAGHLTERLLRPAWFNSVSAVDIMERPAGLPPAARWERCDLNGSTPFAGGSFDAVVSSEVIEHLENPRAVAREWFRILRPRGQVFASTPNNESIRSLIALAVRGHHVAFGDGSYPAHITALLRKDLERILREAGFSEVEFSFSNAGGLPGAPRISWQGVSGGRLSGLRFSDNFLCVATKP